MKMGDHIIGVVQGEIDTGICKNNPGNATDREQEDEAHGP